VVALVSMVLPLVTKMPSTPEVVHAKEDTAALSR
jgi:hypothetical protein